MVEGLIYLCGVITGVLGRMLIEMKQRPKRKPRVVHPKETSEGPKLINSVRIVKNADQRAYEREMAELLTQNKEPKNED